MHDFLIPIYRFLDPILFFYFGFILLSYAFFFIIGALGTFKRFHRINADDNTHILNINGLPEITFFIPTFNDADIILSTIDNIRHLNYRYKQILVINDGSTDETMEVLTIGLELEKIPLFFHEKLPTRPLKEVYRSRLYPEIVVLDKENGEKYDALNMALNACKTAHFAVIDSDTFIEDSEFEALMRPLFNSPNTIAIGAAIKVRNGCKIEDNRIDTSPFPPSFLTGIQSVEYIRSFLMRMGWEAIHNNYIISGAFGIFIRDVVIEVGGYGPTIANDMEIVLRLTKIMQATKTPYQILYRPDPVAWTRVPDSWKELGAQRLRWHRGLFESLWFNKSVFLNPKHGIQGLFVYPYLLIFEGFEPFVEIVGYLYLIIGIIFGIIDPHVMYLLLLIIIGFVFIQTIFALVIDEFSFRKFPSLKSIWQLLFYGMIENFGYRQMTLIWRVQGFFSFLSRFKQIQSDSKKLNQVVDERIKNGALHW